MPITSLQQSLINQIVSYCLDELIPSSELAHIDEYHLIKTAYFFSRQCLEMFHSQQGFETYDHMDIFIESLKQLKAEVPNYVHN